MINESTGERNARHMRAQLDDALTEARLGTLWRIVTCLNERDLEISRLNQLAVAYHLLTATEATNAYGRAAGVWDRTDVESPRHTHTDVG